LLIAVEEEGNYRMGAVELGALDPGASFAAADIRCGGSPRPVQTKKE